MSKPSWIISHNLYDGDGRSHMISWSEEAFDVRESDSLLRVFNESMDNFMLEKGLFEKRHVGHFLMTSSGMSVVTVEMLKEKFNEFIGKYKDEDVVCFFTEIIGSSEP